VRRPSRGFSALEAVVALAVVTLLTAVVMDGGRAESRAALMAGDALRARLAASSRLETVSPDEWRPGSRPFETRRPGLTGHEEVREVSPGLLEVRVLVRAASGARVELVTRVAVRRSS
jgi:hypothetical protein